MQNLGNLDNQYTILLKYNYDPGRKQYLARHNQNHNYVVIEFLRNGDINNFPANVINILNILRNVDNPYILHSIQNGNGLLTLNNKPPVNKPYIIYEYAVIIDLSSYLMKGRFTERQAKLLFKKILIGLQAIHNAGICHRNIKPNNILFDANFNPKISYFYFSCLNANNLQGHVGTDKYMAPEILSNKPYDGILSDIFSLAQLLFTMVTGRKGFQVATGTDKFYSLIMNHHFDIYWKLFDDHNLNLSQSFKDLYMRMVAFEPKKRPTIEEILNSEWMQEINNLNEAQLNALENEIRQELHFRTWQLMPEFFPNNDNQQHDYISNK